MMIFAGFAFLWVLFVALIIGINVAQIARKGRSRRRHGTSGPYGSTWDSSTWSNDYGSWSSSSDDGSSWGSSDCGSSWSSSDSGSSGSDSGSSCS